MNKKNKKYPLFYVSPGPEVARAAGNDDHEPGLNFDDIDSDGGFDFVVFFFTEFSFDLCAKLDPLCWLLHHLQHALHGSHYCASHYPVGRI